MKILSWNVNGIRSAHRKGFLKWITRSGADIVCLQEIKAHREQFPKNLLDVPGLKRFDQEGRMLRLKYSNFVLMDLYFPHGGHEKNNLGYKLEAYRHLFNYLKKNKDKNYYKMIEQELIEVKGLKTLISTNCYSEEEFWKIAKDLFAEVGLKEEIEKDEKEETSRERKVNNYLEFVNSLFLFGERRENPSLGDFLDYVALFTDQDGLDEKADRVSLMTVHAAKGLEFEYVALTGLIEGQFPNQNAILGGQVDEERRLFYVALTRAQRMLLLSMSKTRRYYGETQNNTLSRFVEEIDQELFEISPLGQGTEQQKKQAAVSAREAFFARLKKPG